MTATTATRIDSVYRPHGPLDVNATLGHLMSGTGDPRMQRVGPVWWFALGTPHGAATLALRELSGEVRIGAWAREGENAAAEWAVDLVPQLLGASDDASDFDASLHPLIEQTHHRNRGLKLSRTNLVFDALASAILEQKVTTLQAYRAWRYLLRRFGERAPGPQELFAAPTPAQWAQIPSWEWHRAGVEPPQSRALVRAAQRGERLAELTLAAQTGAERDRVLTSTPGVGAWTAATTRIRALGDADAVSVGDYHLAHQVGYALTGARTDDDGMLELLEPWRGQRQRVIRLILHSGTTEPRRGPKVHPEDHRQR